jgi:ribosomal protein L11 methyltransferase
MSQTRLYFDMPQDAAVKAAARLEAEFEADGFPVSAFEVDEKSGTWNISVYVPAGEAGSAGARIREALGEDVHGPLQHEELEDGGWVEKTLSELAPVRAGRFVVHGSHDAGCASANEHAILIDAGLAFGTGHHGTTAGCLEMIGDVLKRGKPSNALDLGTGSGVLAIAIAKATKKTVLASDIDPVSVEVTRENARINEVPGLIEAVTAIGFNHTRFAEKVPFDLIVANILAGPLRKLAPALAAHLGRGGSVILSGLLPHQQARIVAAYRAQGLRLDRAIIRNGWLTLLMRDMRA